jgi:hypothetical protein
MKLSLTFGKRLVLLVALFIVGLVMTGVLELLITRLLASTNMVAALRITAVCQNLFAFVLPAVVLALLVTRLPANFLQIRGRVPVWQLLLALCVWCCSVPAMNVIVAWNDSWPLPESLAQLEEAAKLAGEMMMGGDTVTDLVLSVLIMGVLTGVGEELFFRGAIQRVLQTRPMNPHVAIWITALIFTLMHGQFAGIVPRLLLGAFFGYVYYWSRSLWVPIICHAFNNSMVVTLTWLGMNSDEIGVHSPLLICGSVLLTAAGIYLLRRR